MTDEITPAGRVLMVKRTRREIGMAILGTLQKVRTELSCFLTLRDCTRGNPEA